MSGMLLPGTGQRLVVMLAIFGKRDQEFSLLGKGSPGLLQVRPRLGQGLTGSIKMREILRPRMLEGAAKRAGGAFRQVLPLLLQIPHAQRELVA